MQRFRHASYENHKHLAGKTISYPWLIWLLTGNGSWRLCKFRMCGVQDVSQGHASQDLPGDHKRQAPGQAPLRLLLPPQGTPSLLSCWQFTVRLQSSSHIRHMAVPEVLVASTCCSMFIYAMQTMLACVNSVASMQGTLVRYQATTYVHSPAIKTCCQVLFFLKCDDQPTSYVLNNAPCHRAQPWSC